MYKLTRSSLWQKKIIVLPAVGIVLTALLLLTPEVLGNSNSPLRNKTIFQSSILPITLSAKANFDIGNIESYKGYPVGKIEKFGTPNSWGTVVFIPQYHKNPGSSDTDPKNDSAQIAQTQIYQILNYLKDKSDVRLVAVEGELYGEVPAEKFASLADKVTKRNTLASNLQLLKNQLQKDSVDPTSEKSLVEKLTAKINELDRSIILQGAPLKMKAEGKNINLYGMENKDTQDASRVLVRDYIYLQDRMDQLNTLSSKTPNTQLLLDSRQNQASGIDSLSNNSQLMQELLKLLAQKPSTTINEFTKLESEAAAKGKDQLVQILKKTNEALQNFSQTDVLSSNSITNTNSAPSRQDNPYNSVSNKAEIQQKMTEEETQINRIVVDQRNQETAVNFAKVLKEKGVNTGILQFGAGHEAGMVKELNKQGLNVVVITADEVTKRNSEQVQ